MPEKQKPKVEFSRNGGLVGSVCVSLAGHDAASVLIVVGEGDGCVLVADGKRRLIKAPKAKKTKHISIISKLSAEACEMISNGKANDSMLRREISSVTRGILS